MLAVVVSRADSASVRVGERLRELADWTEHTDGTRPDGEGGGVVYRTPGPDGRPVGEAGAELREVDTLHLETEDVGDRFGTVDDGPDRDPDLLAFASRHAGETGPLLTAHHTGNFGPAAFGGTAGELARAAPNAHSRVLRAFREHAPDGYDVGTECTHHGPSSVGRPSLFVELGSGEDQWTDPAGARAVAEAILALRGVSPDASDERAGGGGRDGPTGSHPSTTGDRRHLVGFGGGHYAPRFERIARETDWAVGHVAADWALDELNPADCRDVIGAAFEESAATRAVVDGDRPGVERAVADLGYRVVSETWVRETGGRPGGRDPVPLPLAERLEEALVPVDEGLRFGDRARDSVSRSDGRRDESSAADGVAVVDLPAELLAEAQGVDREATRAAVERSTLAFETSERGSRVGGRAALSDRDDRETVVDALADVLATEYEAVERVDGAVRARERAFDPERARDLGVPEGPAFGRLADGQPVEVDGETVAPEDVHAERERRFPVENGTGE